MYSTLSKYNDSTSMDTSNKKYSCPNYVHPKTQNFYNYYNLPSSQNTNVEQLPFYKVNQEGKTIGPPTVLPTVSSTKESFLPSYSMETNDAKDITVDNQKSISLDETANVTALIRRQVHSRSVGGSLEYSRSGLSIGTRFVNNRFC